MISFGTFALIWPFIAVALALGLVFLAEMAMDRREQRQHPTE
jgi:hypothetical protein